MCISSPGNDFFIRMIASLLLLWYVGVILVHYEYTVVCCFLILRLHVTRLRDDIVSICFYWTFAFTVFALVGLLVL